MSDSNKDVLLQEFRQFISEMNLISRTYVDGVKVSETVEPDDHAMRPLSTDPESIYYKRQSADGVWGYNLQPMSDDFNKQILLPGKEAKLKDGIVIVRSDDDFFKEGLFPYRFHELTIQDIVAVIWPDIKDPSFGPDVFQ